ASLESALAERLFAISHQILIAQYRLLEDDLAFDEYCRLLDEPRTRAYLLRAYPVLQACMDEASDRWVHQCALLLERLSLDASLIGLEPFDDAPPPPLETVRLGLGDVHRGGASVAVLAFEDGRRLVYKPRPLALDLALSGLLDELAASTGLRAGFRIPGC